MFILFHLLHYACHLISYALSAQNNIYKVQFSNNLGKGYDLNYDTEVTGVSTEINKVKPFMRFVLKTIFQHLLMQLPELFPNGQFKHLSFPNAQFKHRFIFGNVSYMDDFRVKEESNFFVTFHVVLVAQSNVKNLQFSYRFICAFRSHTKVDLASNMRWQLGDKYVKTFICYIKYHTLKEPNITFNNRIW